MIDHLTAANFVATLTDRHLAWAPRRSAISCLVTTSDPGKFAGVTLADLAGVAPGGSPSATDVSLRGTLPRLLRAGENVTVAVNRFDAYQGYQIKSAALRDRAAAGEVLSSPDEGKLVVHGQRTFTTHHGPYTQRFFERVPHDDVRTTAAGVRHVLVAIGPEANVSPRFVYGHELRDGQLVTFHGDGATMKTYRNLAANRSAVQVVLDLEKRHGYAGYALFGRCEEVAPDAHPEIWREVCRGFQEVGFGVPSRLFRHACERIEPLARPTARS